MLIGCVIRLGWVILLNAEQSKPLVRLYAMCHYYHNTSDSPPEWKHVTPSHDQSERHTDRNMTVPHHHVRVCTQFYNDNAYLAEEQRQTWRGRGGGGVDRTISIDNMRLQALSEMCMCDCKYPIVHSVCRCPIVHSVCVFLDALLFIVFLCVSRCPIVDSVCVFLDALLLTVSVFLDALLFTVFVCF